MPYTIRKVERHYYEVYNSETGHIHAYHRTLERAKAQVRFLFLIKDFKI
jgi:hypothetical protein